MRPTLQALLGIVLFMGATLAPAAPPKDKEDAPDVVTGTVQKLTTSVDQYEDGRAVTQHTALVKVEAVERTTLDNGRVIKAGDTITVRWKRLTWASRTVGYTYDVNENATIRVYLARQCGGAQADEEGAAMIVLYIVGGLVGLLVLMAVIGLFLRRDHVAARTAVFPRPP